MLFRKRCSNKWERVDLTPAQAGILQNAVSGFNSNGQVASSFHNQPLNVTFTPLASTTLSNDGSATAITIASTQIQFGAGIVNYNSASVDPGTFTTSYVTGLDPQFAGGSIFFLVAPTTQFQSSTDSVLPFGKIITSSTVITSGGGATGGTTAGSAPARGGAGGRGITF